MVQAARPWWHRRFPGVACAIDRRICRHNRKRCARAQGLRQSLHRPTLYLHSRVGVATLDRVQHWRAVSRVGRTQDERLPRRFRFEPGPGSAFAQVCEHTLRLFLELGK